MQDVILADDQIRLSTVPGVAGILKEREGMGAPEPAFFVSLFRDGCSARATPPLWSAALCGRLSTAHGAAREGKGRIKTLAYRVPSGPDGGEHRLRRPWPHGMWV